MSDYIRYYKYLEKDNLENRYLILKVGSNKKKLHLE